MFDRFKEIELNKIEAGRIAQDLQQKLGVPVRNIQQFETATNQQLAEQVLPLAAEWVPRATRGDIRACLYNLFATKHAHSFVPTMLDWLRVEEHVVAIHAMKSALSVAMRPSDAERVWSVLQFKDLDGADVPFLLQLAKSKKVGVEVNDAILAGLESGTWSVFCFDRLSSVKDDRIREALFSRVNDPDPEVRKRVRRLFALERPLPKSLRKTRGGPDRRVDLFSTEVDNDKLFVVLTLIESQFGVRLPPEIADLAFLEDLPVDRWFRTAAEGESDAGYTFWFRLETDDVVEVVLQRISSPNLSKTP
ncbi:MAG TPA: hypothetical protein PLF84_15095 [Bryobacteraceae bacterium]|nr:hypothetical protein [Bryobacterales bacterium]HRJ20373.1 hypothetical protein [Bryobacteraceae bacterium]